MSSKSAPETVEETKSGGKQAYGTHNYPDHLTHIDKLTWDVVVVGAGPAGLMLTVSGTSTAARCSIVSLLTVSLLFYSCPLQASLARFGGHNILTIDERSEPTTAGRADGIQPRVSPRVVFKAPIIIIFIDLNPI